MDVGALIRGAREAARLSQAQLALRAGTSQAAVQAYEKNRVSPTVRTLDRLLAAMDLQQRVSLEPLLAHVDARVDRLMQPVLPPEHDVWSGFVPSLEAAGASWAVDGASALRLHGLNAEEDGFPWAALVFDDPGRRWLAKGFARGSGRLVSWWEAELDEGRASLGRVAVTMHGMLRLRLVEELDTVVQVRPPWREAPLPVVSVDEVERAFPVFAETLARWRQRRGAARPSAG